MPSSQRAVTPETPVATAAVELPGTPAASDPESTGSVASSTAGSVAVRPVSDVETGASERKLSVPALAGLSAATRADLIPTLSPEAVRRHWQATALSVAIAVGLFAVDFASRTQAPTCSYQSDLASECGCYDGDVPQSSARLQIAVLGTIMFAVPTLVLQWKQLRAALNEPDNPRACRAFIIYVPLLILLSLGYSHGPNAIAMAYVLAWLSYLLGLWRWRGSGHRRAVFRAAVPHIILIPGSGVYGALFTALMPALLRDSEDGNWETLVLAAQMSLLGMFSIVVIRIVSPFVRYRWPVGMQSMLVRAELQRTSGAHIAMTLATVELRGYEFADLHAGHPIVLSLLFYVVMQSALRLHGVSVVTGTLRGLTWREIRDRKSPMIACYGRAKDARFWAYVSALAVRVLPGGREQSHLSLCGGRYVPLGDASWVLLLLAVDVLVELIYVAAQRVCTRKWGSDHPFGSPMIVHSALVDNVLFIAGTMMIGVVGQFILAAGVLR